MISKKTLTKWRKEALEYKDKLAEREKYNSSMEQNYLKHAKEQTDIIIQTTGILLDMYLIGKIK